MTKHDISMLKKSIGIFTENEIKDFMTDLLNFVDGFSIDNVNSIITYGNEHPETIRDLCYDFDSSIIAILFANRLWYNGYINKDDFINIINDINFI